MEKKRLKLPTGIQTFEKLRDENCVYVDKTQYLVNLMDTGSIYFLSRPRRFGKSLTISYLNRPEFKPFQIISLNMSNIANILKIKLSDTKSCGDLLTDLIPSTFRKYNQKMVILVDEYDSPYTEFVNDSDMAEEVRKLLRNYSVRIKANDEYIRFVFIIGISKVAKSGIFSTLNTTTDISMMPEYAEMCGYTEEKMRHYYNSFSFDCGAQARLYNPFSTLSFFMHKKFLNNWFNTGKPKMIAEYMKKIMIQRFNII